MVSAKTNKVITVTGTGPDNYSINIYFTGEMKANKAILPWFHDAAWAFCFYESGGGKKKYYIGNPLLQKVTKFCWTCKMVSEPQYGAF